MSLSSTQIGSIDENLVANELLIKSNGRLSSFEEACRPVIFEQKELPFSYWGKGSSFLIASSRNYFWVHRSLLTCLFCGGFGIIFSAVAGLFKRKR